MKSYIRLINILFISALLFSGCAARTKINQAGPSEQEQLGPFPESAVAAQAGTAEQGPMPEPGFVAPADGYVLVLGPGYARTLSFVGVLRALEESHIPIRAIVGVEMGAMIGTIWATSNSNYLEWEIHKFNRADLLDIPLLGLRDGIAAGRRYLKFLEASVKIDNLKKTKIPVTIVSAVVGMAKDGALVESAGSAKDILRGAIGLDTVLRSHTWNSIERESAVLQNPMPVDVARKMGLGKTLCVDVVGTGEVAHSKNGIETRIATIMRSVATNIHYALKDCDSSINIVADGVGYLDFDSKANLVYQGKIAAQKWVEQNK